MKQIIFLLYILFFNIGVQAQTNSKMAISIVLPDDLAIPQSSVSMLHNKMKAIVVQNGYADMAEQRFILTASVDIIEKGYNSAGMMMQKMAITFYVCDVLENKIYSTATINTLGMGQSDIKAYNMAFQRINPSAPQITQLLARANSQIVDFYTAHYSDLVAETDRLVEMEQYDEAITKLITVPSFCVEAYNDAQSRCVSIYHKKMDALTAMQKAKTNKEGLVLIQQAKAAWVSRQDYESASNALAILAQISPEAECIDQANEFIQSINDKLRTDELNKAKAEQRKAAAAAAIAQRNWEFKMRQYEDNLAMAKQKQADNAAILGTLAERFGRFDINVQKNITQNGNLKK